MPDKPLTELRVSIKEILATDLEKSLLSLKERLLPDCGAYDEVIIALERSTRIQKALQKGLIQFQEADMLLNQIVNSFIFTLNNLRQEDLRKVGA